MLSCQVTGSTTQFKTLRFGHYSLFATAALVVSFCPIKSPWHPLCRHKKTSFFFREFIFVFVKTGLPSFFQILLQGRLLPWRLVPHGTHGQEQGVYNR